MKERGKMFTDDEIKSIETLIKIDKPPKNKPKAVHYEETHNKVPHTIEHDTFSDSEIQQASDLIDSNLAIISKPKGDMKKHLSHIKYLKQLLIYFHDKQKLQLRCDKLTNRMAFRVTMYDMKLNAFRSLNTQPDDDTIKKLIRLLLLTGAISRVTYKELTTNCKSMYRKYETSIFQAMNQIYIINDLQDSHFERLTGIQDIDLSYTATAIVFNPDITEETFKQFTDKNEHWQVSQQVMNEVVEYMKSKKVVTLKDVAQYQNSIFITPFGNSNFWETKTEKERCDFYISLYKDLEQLKWWRQYDISIKPNSKVRYNKLDVHGNVLVMSYVKRKIKNT